MNKSKHEEKANVEDVIPKFKSSYHEYMAGYWSIIKRPKIQLTIDTVIQSIPLNILEAPDESAYHRLQTDLDEKIDALYIKNVKFSINIYILNRKNKAKSLKKGFKN